MEALAAHCQPKFGRAADVTKFTAELLLPPRRLTPSEACRQYLRNDKGSWEQELSPMMIEPLDHIGGREYTGVVFVGPARSSKTYTIILGGLCYIVTCAPGDTLIIQMSGEAARDFSRGDVDRTIRHSPALLERLSPRAKDDNTFDKFWRNGMSLKLGWPAVSQLSSKTLQYVFITDYDRPENRDNVDGEGPVWDLAGKRIETYMSRGKIVAESSPGEEQVDPNWRPMSPHEAPPVQGILSLYNRGTRARWYWPCLHCGVFSEAKPGLECFNVPDFDDVCELVKKNNPRDLAEKYALVACKKCGSVHRMENRHEMNLRGQWLHEGQKFVNGERVGQRRKTLIASYWLGGVAATYQRWDSLLEKYFEGVRAYVRGGDEQGLKATTLTDQAYPYLSRAIAKHRGPEALLSRQEDWPKAVVPQGVRYLTASIDVQMHCFSVQVVGGGIGQQTWLVDTFKITTSKRKETDTRNAVIDPAAYIEDWDVLIEEVIKRTYPVHGLPNCTMGVTLTLCDSGGRDGVTARAYDFWRKLRGVGLHQRFFLVKGDGRVSVPLTNLTWPDTRNVRGRKDRAAFARGDVPVYLLNVNLIKDAVSIDLARDVVGPGYAHFPKWVDSEFFDELTAETRDEDGKWEKKSGGVRNEELDKYVYNRAARVILKVENINWEKPPSWAIDPALRGTNSANLKTRAERLRELAKGMNSG